MAKAAMAPLFVDPTARFVNDLITSEIEVSEKLLSRVWPAFSAADLLFDEAANEDDADDEFAACDGDDDDVEIEFEADEDEDGFFADLASWSPRKKG
ncbi:MAG: hypothetical protein LDL26_02960 [Caenispirillum bisanense]|uniref:Uncharacterized protein n=1 Tax=Caenispirillum bisanense TaxID=414052 RepID=A0A286G7X8_9PROT|nr:hypothetical protein [Caenispirillum bisanense]MCA1939936.1 hypothetical protein [Caenispirillum bisanense]MCA1972049.1 hypothetical protein [Caenispirillum sp.]SOD91602.1 hypothetical protein SAMN05421508_1028 [Caenispirillum bisanense]